MGAAAAGSGAGAGTPPPPPPPAPAVGQQPADRLPMPSRNPLPLSASQEAQVRDLFYARVRQKCAVEIKAFADCAQGRTFSAPFACRPLHRVMNGCMAAAATPAEHDAAREDWFALRLERAREREKKRKRKDEQERFHREWWGLPDRVEEEGGGNVRGSDRGAPGSSGGEVAAARNKPDDRSRREGGEGRDARKER